MHHNQLDEEQVIQMLKNTATHTEHSDNETIVYSMGGKPIIPRSANQRKVVEAYQKMIMLFISGPAGSGKTFTLAVEYISLLVKDPENYQHILAVTFTNKATQEMKMRILSQLYGIANSLQSSQQYFNKVKRKNK